MIQHPLIVKQFLAIFHFAAILLLTTATDEQR